MTRDDEGGENERLEALRAYEILDTDPEEAFDDIVRLASHIFDTPVALITLVDEERQWFKANLGLEGVPQTPREVAFCAHAIEAPDDVMVVDDAREDPRFASNPLVTGDPHIRFYAGAPILTPAGQPLGTVCVIDRKPREITEVQLQALRELAGQAAAQLELRKALRELHTRNLELEALLEERRQREEELARLAAIVESSNDAILSMTPEGVIRTWNPGAERLYGFVEEEMVGRRIQDVVPPDRVEELNTLLGQVRAGERPPVLETTRLRKTGEAFDAALTASPVVDADGTTIGVSWMVHDITQRKRAEREAKEALVALNERNQELRRINEVKTNFVSVVSHEFRTPLTVIQGFAEMLAEESFPEAEVREYARDIFVEAHRLTRLITDMLDLDRMESGQLRLAFEPLDLERLLEDLRRRWSNQSEAHRFELEAGSALPPLEGDADRLRQVFTNLLSNAVKYSPEGGTVAVTVHAEPERVRVQVRDEGVGIDPEMTERIFDRYARAGTARDREFGGTGLGLSISRQIVELHGGTLKARPAPGKGSIFEVSLPAGERP